MRGYSTNRPFTGEDRRPTWNRHAFESPRRRISASAVFTSVTVTSQPPARLLQRTEIEALPPRTVWDGSDSLNSTVSGDSSSWENVRCQDDRRPSPWE